MMTGRTENAKGRQTPLALIVVSVLFLAPIGLLATLFFQESRKDIVFVDNEIEGVKYAQTVWPIMAEALTARGPGLDAAMHRWDPVREAGEANDPQMETFDARRALGLALSHSDDPHRAKPEILAGAAALINKIDDGSYLTLDPDLRSFYLMDSATLKLPALAMQTGSLAEIGFASAKAADAESASLEARVATARHIERFRDRLAAFDSSADAMARVSSVPDPAILAARNKIDSLAAALIRQVGPPSGADPASGDIHALVIALVEAETEYWNVATSELDRILTSRAGRLIHAQWLKLATVAALCVGIFLIVGYMAFSANRGIDKIVKAFRGP